jgi:3-oxoacyl-[acyl-carrier-protein] synthase-3
MIGVEVIASYVPDWKESNYDLKGLFEVDDDFIEQKIGVRRRPRKQDSEETSDLCVRAFQNLARKLEISGSEVDFLVVCTQNPDGRGLPHTSAVVHEKLSCGDGVAAFDISLGCSGYVYALSVACAFMQSNGLTRGLLFTADPYSKIVRREDKNTALLFGDAATVTLLGQRPRWLMECAEFGTRGSDGDALICLEDGDIDLFLMHQGTRFMVEQLARRLGLDGEKTPINLDELGNTVSSSVPLLFEEVFDRSEIKRVVISGFGVGLSWASAVLARADR